MANRRDLRVVKTQRALSSAMLSLLDRVPFTKITVNDLCAEALVSRSAFYAHYQDKYSLLMCTLNRLSEDLFAQTAAADFKGELAVILQKVQQESKTFKNLLIAEYDGELMTLLRTGFIAQLHRREGLQFMPSLPEPREVSSVFFAAGFAGIIMQWVAGDLAYTPEEMTSCLHALLTGE